MRKLVLALVIVISLSDFGETTNEYDIVTFTVNGVSFNMIFVQGGTFTMGATPEQGRDVIAGPPHQVTLSDYYIGQTEVTQELWVAVMGENISCFRGDNLPADGVNWDECQVFIQKLNQLTGENFRLPTEAEWEYAARGGNRSEGYMYSGSNDIDEVAWYGYKQSFGTQPVATKRPNELGIYDMSGSLWEWCQDWYGFYSTEPAVNPQGPSTGLGRVMRGGNWLDIGSICKVSERYYRESDCNMYILGFRLCL